MFVTHKIQPYTLLKLPNFEQNYAKFPIQSPREHGKKKPWVFC